MKLWRCSICGELIHSEEVPELCPRCGVGSDFFDLVEEKEKDMDLSSNKKIVIIGAGIAGYSVAKTLRELDSTCQIDMFSMEHESCYDRTQLTKKLFEVTKDSFNLASHDDFMKQKINLHLASEIIKLNVEEKTVQSKDGSIFSYDDLVLAMGAQSNIPPILHNDLQQIYSLRTKHDAYAIQAVCKPGRKAVIVGGGILGLELACSLADVHLEVDIIEALPSIMARQLDRSATQLLCEYIKKQKITIHNNVQVKEFHGNTRVETVELTNGKCINCDFVVISAGICSDLSMLASTPIHHDKTIPVDPYMRTNINHIYACGDVASFEDKRFALWSIAQEQALVVAYNIAGKQSTYQQNQQPIYFKRDDFNLFSIGDVHQMDQHIELLDEEKGTYEKYCYKEDGCSGILLINKLNHVSKALEVWIQKEKFPRP